MTNANLQLHKRRLIFFPSHIPIRKKVEKYLFFFYFDEEMFFSEKVNKTIVYEISLQNEFGY